MKSDYAWGTMTKAEKLQAIRAKVQADGISLRSIARDTALSMNTVRSAIAGADSTLESTINFLYLYLGLKPESERTKQEATSA